MSGKFRFLRNPRLSFCLTFLLVAAVIMVNAVSEGNMDIGIIVAVVFAVVGIVIGAREWLAVQKARELVESGKYVWGKVVDVEMDTAIRVNGRYPSVLVVEHTRPDGTKCLYKSRSLFLPRDMYFPGSQVRVYISRVNEAVYHVDTDSLLRESASF